MMSITRVCTVCTCKTLHLACSWESPWRAPSPKRQSMSKRDDDSQKSESCLLNFPSTHNITSLYHASSCLMRQKCSKYLTQKCSSLIIWPTGDQHIDLNKNNNKTEIQHIITPINHYNKQPSLTKCRFKWPKKPEIQSSVHQKHKTFHSISPETTRNKLVLESPQTGLIPAFSSPR